MNAPSQIGERHNDDAGVADTADVWAVCFAAAVWRASRLAELRRAVSHHRRMADRDDSRATQLERTNSAIHPNQIVGLRRSAAIERRLARRARIEAAAFGVLL